MLNALQKRLKGKKAHNKAVFCSANRFGRAAAEKRRDPVFKPQGNSIIPKRKFVMTFQKRRARRARLFAPAGRKSGEQKAARQGVRRARKMVQGESVEACGKTMGGGALRFARPFDGALAPLGSPPGRLALLNYSGAEFCRACFFLTAARK